MSSMQALPNGAEATQKFRKQAHPAQFGLVLQGPLSQFAPQGVAHVPLMSSTLSVGQAEHVPLLLQSPLQHSLSALQVLPVA